MKLERFAELTNRPQRHQKVIEETKEVPRKRKFICIDPDDYSVIPAPKYKKEGDQLRQTKGKDEMEILLDMFDCDALLGTNVKNLNRFKNQLDFPEESKKETTSLKSAILS